jgi:hypothetical protein
VYIRLSEDGTNEFTTQSAFGPYRPAQPA